MSDREREVLPGVRAMDFAAYLARWLGAPAPLELESVLLAGQGMSDDTILVDAVDAAGARHALALRRYKPEGILREFVDPARHFRTLAALGATRRDIMRLVLGQALRLTAIGVVMGLVLAAAAARLFSELLVGVRPFDPATFAGVTGLLAAIAVLASYLPARRAARLDPLQALRYE